MIFPWTISRRFSRRIPDSEGRRSGARKARYTEAKRGDIPWRGGCLGLVTSEPTPESAKRILENSTGFSEQAVLEGARTGRGIGPSRNLSTTEFPRHLSRILFEPLLKEEFSLSDEEAFLNGVVEEIRKVTGAGAVSILLKEARSERETFLLRATAGLNPDCVGRTRIVAGEGISGEAIRLRRTLVSRNVHEDGRYLLRRETGEERFQGLIAAPLVRGEKSIGILVFHYEDGTRIDENQERMISVAVEQLVFALEGAALARLAARRHRVLAALNEVASLVGSSLSVRDVIEQLARRALTIIGVEALLIRLLEPLTGRLVPAASRGRFPSGSALPTACDVDTSLPGQSVIRRQGVVFENPSRASEDPFYAQFRNVLLVPILGRTRVIGTLELFNRIHRETRTPDRFDEYDLRVMSTLGTAAGQAYAKADLYAEIEAVALNYRRRNKELSFLNKLSRQVLGSLSEEEILHVILTGITSGHGLGFNRALILLVDDEGRNLCGRFGIGPTTEEVEGIWKEVPKRYRTLEDFFESVEYSDLEKSPFNRLVVSLSFPLSDSRSLLARVISERRAFNLRNVSTLMGIDGQLARAVGLESFTAVPILTRELAIGVILVDNCFTRRPIPDSDLTILQTVANHCGMALEGARMMEQIQSAARKLETTTAKLVESERLAAIGEIAAGVAHDIRNPLTAIGGFTNRLARRLPEGDPGFRYVEIIRKEVRRLEKLARDVLDLASAQKTPSRRVVINKLLVQWYETNAEILKEKRIRMEIPEEQFTVPGDPILLGQAVTNILTNALEAIGEDGIIKCRITEQDSAKEGRATGVCLEITDTGGGMPEALRNRIFEPFFTTKTEGTGLGLSLALKAVRAHGGEIDVAARENEGTTFRIFLPHGEIEESAPDEV